MLALGSVAVAQVGPDVIYSEISGVAHYGPEGGMHAYALGSHTCNVGDEDMVWNGGSGSPWLAMNAYRLQDGRIMQIGMSWCKNACCAAAGSGCPLVTCNGVGGQQLGVGCRDIYGAFYNGGQSRLGPRSGINAFTGQISNNSTQTSTSAIYKRLQIPQSDLTSADAMYFVEGHYIAVDEIPGAAATNNVSYRPVSVSPTTFEMDFPVGAATAATLPAIYAWRDHGNGLNRENADVVISNMDVPGEGRFVLGHNVLDNGDGTWRYEYAIYNINSDRSGRAFAVTVPPDANVTDIGFHDVDYHSGERYDPTDWRAFRFGNQIVWQTARPYENSPSGNALRWGTMYNFWYTADAAPVNGGVRLGLFKPGTPDAVDGAARAPSGCQSNLNGDNVSDIFDLLAYLDEWFVGSANAEFTGDLSASVDVFDLLQYLTYWFDEAATGCV